MTRQRTAVSIDITRAISAQPAYLSIAEAAALLRRSVRAIARWEHRGLLRVVRPAGGNPLIERTEIERILAEGTSACRGTRSE